MDDDITPLTIPADQPASETAFWLILVLLGSLADALGIPPEYL